MGHEPYFRDTLYCLYTDEKLWRILDLSRGGPWQERGARAKTGV